MDHISYISVALCGSSMENGGAHCSDALPLGLPFHLDAYLEHAHIEYSFQPAFIRKRNERERHRVRCVNEGYARLRKHLPQELEEKRLSKVETLRAAIHYIKQLQSLLNLNVSGMQASADDAGPPQRSEWSSNKRPRAGVIYSGNIVL